MKKFIFTCLILLSLVIPSYGATYYISLTGNDTTGDGSTGYPWATLHKAYETMSGGDTLILENGTYTGSDNATGGMYNPPVGTAGAYTIVKAKNDGMAVIDGQNTTNMWDVNCVGEGSGNKYWQIEGILFCKSNGNSFSMMGVSYVKVLRCGSYDAGPGNSVNFQVGRDSSYVLLENCYAYGSGKYKYRFYRVSYGIIRQCIGRSDGTGDTDPSAVFAIFGSKRCEIQNCIAIDTDQWITDDRQGCFFMPCSGVSEMVNFRQCICLNVKLGGLQFAEIYNASNVIWNNCVVLDRNDLGKTLPNGKVKYIKRIKTDLNLSGKDKAGTDIGLMLIGTPGTLWGETGYANETKKPMWPFPDQGLIRSKMAVYAGGSIKGARGFCADGETLPSYIMKHFGNGDSSKTLPSAIEGIISEVDNGL